MNKIAIIHFQPLEYYPPIQNILNYFNVNLNNFEKNVYSSHNNKSLKYFNDNNIKIYRYCNIKQTTKTLSRLFQYFKFNLFTTLSLIKNKPEIIFYFESISSFPAYFIKKIVYPKTIIMIHYHEYTSKKQYAEEMYIVRFFHLLESYIYKKANWISHTNSKRLELFTLDNKDINHNSLHILPNFPPITWQKSNPKKAISSPVKFIYVGSLSFENTYIKEFCTWILQNSDIFRFDIYAYNLSKEMKEYLISFDQYIINYKCGIEYEQLPNIFKNYDIGIIIYKAFSDNYIYNAPNKLFEYLASDLDVWFSEEMAGSFEYIRTDKFPKVLKVNFNTLSEFDYKKAIERNNLVYAKNNYYCEKVYSDLVAFIKTQE